MSAYPWYTRVLDLAHRATVTVLAGGTVYMLGGLGYILWANNDPVKYESAIPSQQQLEQLKESSIPKNFDDALAEKK
ncbi:hypothetical protein BABINDRAFT_163136 [Babjeviella inositovora NRRL Y-12698]|uniref:Uncharacterized protein n=1 Tax=Babjeviella inositovora NRRL Y-12698 TaxID=984486 RepID=A0A1E3QKE4_9ASCO|nr:uncharacterized protein BABINDRAFT_163136 [Babjeviella inositovora NRRL Y-12698]ODQ78120.1 hypothetical protein BABINDRAFT_163136 [Babjeviella inositovora NRRL Y-12698]